MIYGGYLANKYLQTCRAGARLPPKKNNDDRCNLRRLSIFGCRDRRPRRPHNLLRGINGIIIGPSRTPVPTIWGDDNRVARYKWRSDIGSSGTSTPTVYRDDSLIMRQKSSLKKSQILSKFFNIPLTRFCECDIINCVKNIAILAPENKLRSRF